MAGKYQPLRERLESLSEQRTTCDMSFAQIDHLVGGLPPSARRHRGWWSRQSGFHANAWRDAGWLIESVDLDEESVTFHRGTAAADAAAPASPAAGGPQGVARWWRALRRPGGGALTALTVVGIIIAVLTFAFERPWEAETPAIPTFTADLIENNAPRANDKLLPFLTEHQGDLVRLDVKIEPSNNPKSPGYAHNVEWKYGGKCEFCGSGMVYAVKLNADAAGIYVSHGFAHVRGHFVIDSVDDENGGVRVATVTPVTAETAARAHE